MMRQALGIVMLVGLVACGKVQKYNDGGDDDVAIDANAGIDAKPELDGMPFVCEDQSCGAADSCCPSACNANNDADCAAACGNNVLEEGEYCDPQSSCPSSCPQVGCQLRTLTGTGCAAHCVDGAQQAVCQSGDGCCPSGCNATNDLECAATCNNSVLESGETCDPLSSCPASCPQIGCSLFTLFNQDTCQAQCVETGTQNVCQSGDGCCPDGCNSTNDGDCAPVCGNSVVEAGETCDNNCPVCTEVFSCFEQLGDPTNCNVVCHQPIQTCGPADGCCPDIAGSGNGDCRQGNDSECAGAGGWQYREWYQTISWAPNAPALLRIYGMQAGDSVLFTTCSPDGAGVADGSDSMILSVVNGGDGYNYFPTLNPVNDDTNEPFSIPLMNGWNCKNPQGSQYMSTAPHNDGGVILRGNAFRVDVTVGGFGNSNSGRSRFFIWWNGNSNPNPG
jgi:hypothetical protein